MTEAKTPHPQAQETTRAALAAFGRIEKYFMSTAPDNAIDGFETDASIVRRTLVAAANPEVLGDRCAPHLAHHKLELEPNGREHHQGHRTAGEEDHGSGQAGGRAEAHAGSVELGSHGGNGGQHQEEPGVTSAALAQPAGASAQQAEQASDAQDAAPTSAERGEFVAWLRSYAGGGENWRDRVLMGEHDAALAAWRHLYPNAARYTYLRERDLDAVHAGGVFAGRTPDNVVLNGEDLDAAIDAGMAAVECTWCLGAGELPSGNDCSRCKGTGKHAAITKDQA